RLRRRAQVDRFLVAFVAWSVAATGWGFLQFVGAVNEFEGKRPGQREVSFLGIHDFAGFSGATLAIGLAAIALAQRRRLAIVAVAAGAIGLILAASVFAFAGIVLAAAAALVVGARARTPTRAAAKRKFPDQPAQAYPTPAHPWGVQNFWVQLPADTGVFGLLLGLGTFVAALVTALRAPPRFVFLGLVAAGWIFVAAGTWNAVGIVAGVPLQAITWLGFGLAAVAGGLE